MSKQPGLTPKLLEVSQLLASGMTYTQISDAIGEPRSSVGRWAKLEAVRAQVELLRADALQAHVEISREAATASAEGLQEKLTQGVRREEELMAKGYSLGHDLFDLTHKMVKVAAEVFTSGKDIEHHEKILITSLPGYMRAAGDMLQRVSDCEDKLYSLQEISKRLDEWESLRNDQN